MRKWNVKREKIPSRFTFYVSPFTFYALRFNYHTQLTKVTQGVNLMARPKYDGVIQAVRYTAEGQVLWVRAYLRRGPTWSDHVLLDRLALIQQLKSGKRFFAGHRIPLMAGTFEVSAPVRLLNKNGQEILVISDPLVASDLQAENDCLEGVPLL